MDEGDSCMLPAKLVTAAIFYSELTFEQFRDDIIFRVDINFEYTVFDSKLRVECINTVRSRFN